MWLVLVTATDVVIGVACVNGSDFLQLLLFIVAAVYNDCQCCCR